MKFNTNQIEEIFIDSISSWDREFIHKKIKFSIEKGNPEWIPRSIWIDTESSEYIGRFIIWNNGNSNILILSIRDEIEKMNMYLELQNSDDIRNTFNMFMKIYK